MKGKNFNIRWREWRDSRKEGAWGDFHYQMKGKYCNLILCNNNIFGQVALGGQSCELELVLALALLEPSTSTSIAPYTIAFS